MENLKLDLTQKMIVTVTKTACAQLVSHLIEAAQAQKARTVAVKDLQFVMMQILNLTLPGDE